MTEDSPLVTVVIPAYNHEDLVRRAILSVLNNGYPHIELIVIDDGSQDGTWNAIQDAHRDANGSFHAFTQPNAGLCRTLNQGVRIGSGSLVAVLASDDYYLPGKLRAQVDLFQTSGDALGLVHTNAYIDHLNDTALVAGTGRRPARGHCFNELLSRSVSIIAPSIMFRRAAFETVGGFDEGLAAEDLDFFVRLAASNYYFSYIDTPYLVYGVTPGSLGKQLDVLLAVDRAVLEKHRSRFSSSEFDDLERQLLRRFVERNCAAGRPSKAFHLTRSLYSRTGSPSEWFHYGAHATRAALLRAIPGRARHALRLMRMRASQKNEL